MNRTLAEWLLDLTRLCRGTAYDATLNGGKDSYEGVIIIPRESRKPQLILVVPRQTVGTSISIHNSIYDKVENILSSETERPSQDKRTYHFFNELSDEKIIDICKTFLKKD